MAAQQQSLRLFHASNSLCAVMVRGNIALSTGKPAEAIEHYTEVLYKLSPGHVCAFLNRSLAYLEEGYYELAVMDAHRAKIAADEMRRTSPVTDQRLSQVVRYINAERMHVGANDDWTKAPHRNIGKGWAESPLASILVTATPEVRILPFGTNRDSLARALEIRATYRLCGALFMVGDGARHDALDLIEDTKLSMPGKSWVSQWFSKMGNEIMHQIVSVVDPNNSMATRVTGSDTGANRDERMKNLTEKMKARTTNYHYGDYPWNTDEPDFGGIYWQIRLQEWLEYYLDKISPVVIDHNETEEQAQRRVELQAPRTFGSGELMLKSKTMYNVTTFVLEPLKEDEAKGLKPEMSERKTPDVTTGILEYSYCTGCASLLAIPRKFALKLQKDQVTKLPKYVVPACSGSCRELRLELNIGLCRDNIEQELQKEHLDEPNPRLMTDCKTLCLRDLIFLRYVANAMRSGKSPLSIRELMFATCGPHTRSISQITEVDPWSYASHVVRPLKYLDKHLAYTHTDQFANLSKLDGWIIHALLSKISRGMRVCKGPQYAQVYHKDGMPKIAFGPEHPRWQDLTKLPEDKDDDSIVWIAGVDALINMIRIADPAKGESPNVVLVQRDSLYVYAIKTNDGGPAVKAGETLLRAANEVDNLALMGGKDYTEEELDADCLAVTDDEEDDGKDGGEDDIECILYHNYVYKEEEQDVGSSEAHSGDTSDFIEESSAEEDDKDEDEGEGQGEGEDKNEDEDEGEYKNEDEHDVDGEAVLPAEDSSVGNMEKDDEEEVERQPVPPAQDPRAGDWWSSWSWRGGRLHMG